MSEEATAKVLDKVKKLLALSESPNEAEAAAAMEKAHALLRAYNLSMADVPSSNESDIKEYTIEEGSRQDIWRLMLLDGIANSNYCARLRKFTWVMGKKEYAWCIFGREANAQTTVAMFEYLSETVARLGRSAGHRRGVSAVQYMKGMSLRLTERLAAMAIKENTETTALVVVSQEAFDAMNKAHPDTRAAHLRYEEDESLRKGYADGEYVSLNRQVK